MLRKFMVSWEELKRLAERKNVSFHFVETMNAYEVFIREGNEPTYWAPVFKSIMVPPQEEGGELVQGESRYDEAVYNDWMTNYFADANGL